MAKDSERQTAQVMFIDQCLTAKEISSRLGVTEKTIGKWADAGNWKQLRAAKQAGPKALAGKYNDLLDLLLDKRLSLEKKGKRTEDEEESYRGIIDEMSKVSAMIERVQKDGRPSLRTHIFCLEKFSGFLAQKDAKLYKALIDMQIEYLPLLAEELSNG